MLLGTPSSPSLLTRLGRVTAVAVAYFAAGRLGLRLAIPPGFATAVWPPSGIALAAVLLLGPRTWPGVWLGSFAVNLWVSFDASGVGALLGSVALAAGIATGSTLQALVGAFLVRRLIGCARPFDQAHSLFRFVGVE